MADRYKVILTTQALSDLQQIIEYIERDSFDQATRFAARLIAAVDSLEQFPQRYRIYRGKRKFKAPIRRMPFPPYLIITQ